MMKGRDCSNAAENQGTPKVAGLLFSFFYCCFVFYEVVTSDYIKT